MRSNSCEMLRLLELTQHRLSLKCNHKFYNIYDDDDDDDDDDVISRTSWYS